MKKVVLLITVFIMSVALVSCKGKEDEKEDALQNNAGSITFADVEKTELEEYYDDDYWVFSFYVEEKSGMSRREIYDKFLKDKFDKASYLGCGLIVGTAKEILDLEPVPGLDIVMTEFVYENYIVDEEYIEKFEADKDTILVHLNGIEPSKAYTILDNYEVRYISEDYMYDDVYGVYIALNVNKEELKALYYDDIVAGMRKRMVINEGLHHFATINTYIDNYPFEWPKK